MGKKRLLILGVILIAIFGIDLLFYFNNNETGGVVSGFFIKGLDKQSFGINLSLIAFIGQWIILLSIVIFAYARFLKGRKNEEALIQTKKIKISEGKSETPMDSLYKILEENGFLHLEAIAKTFSIPKEKALEWAKILEEDDLVSIEYPAFSDPEITLKGFDKQKIKEKN
ncbi:hypothetical protein HYT23_03635 [Candidatus Pacearchaeota archaeon]|nr:hypothetical protein [Candidatus Pacearchaeota archaeon]